MSGSGIETELKERAEFRNALVTLAKLGDTIERLTKQVVVLEAAIKELWNARAVYVEPPRYGSSED